MHVKHAPPMPPKQLSGAAIPLRAPVVSKTLDISPNHADNGTEEWAWQRVENDVEEISLEEIPEIIEEIGPEPIDSNWQCGECGEICESEINMGEHMKDTHKDSDNSVDKIVYLIPEQCKPCKIKDTRLAELERREEIVKASERELEVLKRRHEQLKQKYDDAIKANKEYSKNLLKTIEENTQIKMSAEKDAEVLMDALNMNQVLMEEIKVKDAIIRTNEELQVVSNRDGVQNESSKKNTSLVECSKCDWTSTNHSQLNGHMIKHNMGQYICSKCKVGHKTKRELIEHNQQMHKANDDLVNLVCITCDKEFPSQHSLKQHMNSKHNSQDGLPVGHPQRAEKKNQESLKIACTQCDKKFATGNQIDEHMKEHVGYEQTNQAFAKPVADKICRYFSRNGYCIKGDNCLFKHGQTQQNPTPMCGRGQGCIFLQQNRCNFFHPGVGVQQPRMQQKSYQPECRYGDQCWNISNCSFSHTNQGFRFAQRRNQPPQGVTVKGMSYWKDY